MGTGTCAVAIRVIKGVIPLFSWNRQARSVLEARVSNCLDYR